VNEVPLLEAHEARIDVDGVAAVERLSLVSKGDLLVLAGDTGALVAALTGVPRAASGGARAASADDAEPQGEAYVVGGSLLLAGRSVAESAHVAIMGAAALDPPLNAAWTAEEYVAWSARLAGLAPRSAREMARAALARVGMDAARKKKLGALALAERRALGLAQAAASGPVVLVAEAPLSGLEGGAAAFVASALDAVGEGRRAVISVARLDGASAESALARRASHVAVMTAGELALEGPPAELFAGATVYALTVRSNAEPLRAELSARGIDLKGGPVRFSAALPAGVTTREILAAARAARAAVVEMVPVIG
jgi:ABC-2 type transport system ATP-binding protein